MDEDRSENLEIVKTRDVSSFFFLNSYSRTKTKRVEKFLKCLLESLHLHLHIQMIYIYKFEL